MPWQRAAADIALERLPSGRYAYQVVVISVPRQSGKTTLLRAIAMQQMMSRIGREVYYTAQTGKDARARWQQLVEAIERDPAAAPRFTVRRSAGDSRITHKTTGSRFAPFAPTPESLHGYTPHVVMVDEAFSLDEVAGQLLLGAVIPAQATISDRQLYIVSTRGTVESTFLNEWIDKGRAGAAGVALIDYGAGEGVDVLDRTTWPLFHPAVGHTISVDDIAAAAEQMPRPEFVRAYGNRTTRTTSHLISAEVWADLASTDTIGDGDALALTYDVAHDLTASTLMLTWAPRRGAFAGVLHSRIVRRDAGVEWLADEVQALAARLKPAVVGADDGGPARAVTAELRRRGLDVRTTTASELASSFSRWMTRIATRTLSHDGTPAFADAVTGLVTRAVSDATVPSRRLSTGDISPAVCQMVAGHLLDGLDPICKPVIDFGGTPA
ncbi:MAG: phage terminase large subunit family protein [Aeromicrobium sp.]|uniref:hypothetical protein n=1 Tax=Aeromicrobium sp. TaxID=1871063 RepID=UPI0039E70ADE